MKKGNIQVSTENIFPIIKKFLYSEHEIFVRELVSNAVDASEKLKILARAGELKEEIGDLRIDLRIDAAEKTITISDQGIGMSEEEVEKYINQLAFSGAEEFLSNYKDKAEGNMIGHFGLGFYSAFMVAEKVVIETKGLTGPPVRWECDGSPNYSLSEGKRKTRGTDIILHIQEDAKEFLEAPTLKTALLKFCKFLPIPIFFEEKQINDTPPLWIKKATEIQDKDYEDFYKVLFPFGSVPLFWIHLNVDYPFHLTGILYFPHIAQSYEIKKDKISLYANQVYVTDEVKDVVPDFLMLLHGVIDSPDIPLNVSRSYLQGDPNVKKISQYITKKVIDKLEEMCKKDRKAYEEKWDSLNIFVKYGMLTDEKFFQRAETFLLFVDTEGAKWTLETLKVAVAPTQTDKDGQLILLYASDRETQDAAIRAAQAEGYKVLLLNTPIDSAFLNHVESKWEKIRCKRVDAAAPSQLIEREQEALKSVLSEAEESTLKGLFETVKREDTKILISLKALTPTSPPVSVVREEWLRRMQEVAQISGSAGKLYASLPQELTLVVNTNHPIFSNLLKEKKRETQQATVEELANLALLSQDLLKGKALTDFVLRHVEKLEKRSLGD